MKYQISYSAPKIPSEINERNGNILALNVDCTLSGLREVCIYLIMTNCKSKHSKLLIENKINLLCSVAELDTSAKKDQDSVNSLYLKIGDKEYSYQDLLKYRIHTDAFDVTFPNKGIFGVLEGGPSKAVADGFYILTEPLKNGTYPIHFKSSLICPDPDCSDPNFVQDIQYTIVAE